MLSMLNYCKYQIGQMTFVLKDKHYIVCNMANVCLQESHTGSSDSSCTVCGSVDRDMQSSLEHDGHSPPEHDAVECNRCSSQDSEPLRYIASSLYVQNLDSVNTTDVVTMATSDPHYNATCSNVINNTEPQQVTSHDGHMNVESNDTVSANMPCENNWAEVSKTSKYQLPPCCQTQSETHVSDKSLMTSVMYTQSSCDEWKVKPVPSTTDTVSSWRPVEMDSVEDHKLTPHPTCGPEAETVMQLHDVGSSANVHGQDILKASANQEEDAKHEQGQHRAHEARQAQQQHLVDEVKQVQQALLRYKSSLQVLESRSTEVVSICISEQFRWVKHHYLLDGT